MDSRAQEQGSMCPSPVNIKDLSRITIQFEFKVVIYRLEKGDIACKFYLVHVAKCPSSVQKSFIACTLTPVLVYAVFKFPASKEGGGSG